MALDSSGQALTYNGQAWTTPTPVTGASGFAGVSCASAAFCAATTLEGDLFTYSGGHWSKPESTGDTLDGVSCASASFCVAVGYSESGYVFTFNGTSWAPGVEVDPGHKLHSISCTSLGFCIAGAATNAFIYKGTEWSIAEGVDPNNKSGYGLASLSCGSPSLCVAVDNAGNVVTYDGSGWLPPQAVDPGVELASASCSTSDSCAVVAGEDVIDYAGRRWLPPTVIDPGRSLSALSCTSASDCMAVDDEGYAVAMH